MCGVLRTSLAPTSYLHQAKSLNLAASVLLQAAEKRTDRVHSGHFALKIGVEFLILKFLNNYITIVLTIWYSAGRVLTPQGTTSAYARGIYWCLESYRRAVIMMTAWPNPRVTRQL